MLFESCSMAGISRLQHDTGWKGFYRELTVSIQLAKIIGGKLDTSLNQVESHKMKNILTSVVLGSALLTSGAAIAAPGMGAGWQANVIENLDLTPAQQKKFDA